MLVARLAAILALSLPVTGCMTTSPSEPGLAAAVAAGAGREDWRVLDVEEYDCAVRDATKGSIVAISPDDSDEIILLYGARSIASHGESGDMISGKMKLSSPLLSNYWLWDPMPIQLADDDDLGVPILGFATLPEAWTLERFRHTGLVGQLWDENGRLLATMTIDSGTLKYMLDYCR